jgi:hypothetical protein
MYQPATHLTNSTSPSRLPEKNYLGDRSLLLGLVKFNGRALLTVKHRIFIGHSFEFLLHLMGLRVLDINFEKLILFLIL